MMPGSSCMRLPGIVVQRTKLRSGSRLPYNTRDGYEQHETNRGGRRRHPLPMERQRRARAGIVSVSECQHRHRWHDHHERRACHEYGRRCYVILRRIRRSPLLNRGRHSPDRHNRTSDARRFGRLFSQGCERPSFRRQCAQSHRTLRGASPEVRRLELAERQSRSERISPSCRGSRNRRGIRPTCAAWPLSWRYRISTVRGRQQTAPYQGSHGGH